MPSNYTQLFVHLVWATWDRLPLIRPVDEPRLYSAISAKCDELRCKLIAVGGVSDHVHVLVEFPTTISMADLAKGIKGSTSHLMNHAIAPERDFKWQGSYGAFTVSKGMLDRVANYVRDQKLHHADRFLEDEWERCDAADPLSKND